MSTKKKLPKAIRRDLHPSSARSGPSDEQAPTSLPAQPSREPAPAPAGAKALEQSAQRVQVEAEKGKQSAERIRVGAESGKQSAEQVKVAADRGKQSTEQVKAEADRGNQSAEPVSVEQSPVLLGTVAVTNASQPPGDDHFARRRRALADRMVERYCLFAGGAGIMPMPLVSLAGVTGINIRMVQVLCKIYGIPFQRDRAKAVLVGLVGGATPTGLAAATASTLAFFSPATTVIALGVSSAAAVTCTRRIGRMFVERFESGHVIE